MSWITKIQAELVDEVAPDGSEIRKLCSLPAGSTVHCRIGPGKVSKCVCHKTVSEIWYVLKGRGELWRKHGEKAGVTALDVGTSHTIPAGTEFQFRVLGDEPLELHIVTLPPWPGDDESFPGTGIW